MREWQKINKAGHAFKLLNLLYFWAYMVFKNNISSLHSGYCTVSRFCLPREQSIVSTTGEFVI